MPDSAKCVCCHKSLAGILHSAYLQDYTIMAAWIFCGRAGELCGNDCAVRLVSSQQGWQIAPEHLHAHEARKTCSTGSNDNTFTSSHNSSWSVLKS
jgi:hypothetical protein